MEGPHFWPHVATSATQANLGHLKMVPIDFPCLKTWGWTLESSLQIYSGGGWRTPLSGPLFWPQMANFGHPGQSGASENGPNGFPMSQNLGMDTRIKSLALSKPKLHFAAILGVLGAKFGPFCLFFLIFWVSKPVFGPLMILSCGWHLKIVIWALLK